MISHSELTGSDEPDENGQWITMMLPTLSGDWEQTAPKVRGSREAMCVTDILGESRRISTLLI